MTFVQFLESLKPNEKIIIRNYRGCASISPRGNFNETDDDKFIVMQLIHSTRDCSHNVEQFVEMGIRNKDIFSPEGIKEDLLRRMKSALNRMRSFNKMNKVIEKAVNDE